MLPFVILTIVVLAISYVLEGASAATLKEEREEEPQTPVRL